jgi:hypothetical protein
MQPRKKNIIITNENPDRLVLSLSICKGGNDPASFGTFFPVRHVREREIFVWVVGMLKANGTIVKIREIYRSYRRVIMIIKSKYRRPYI